MEYKDYYKVLGVDKSAGDDDIRTAFRKLARKYHPDVAEDKVAAEEKFKEINEAYEVLGDPEQRRKYDALGMNWDKAGAGFPGGGAAGGAGAGGFWGGSRGGGEFHFGGTGFSDFFEAFFGGGAGSGGVDTFGGGVGGVEGFGGFGAGAPRRGRDLEADIVVTLEEAFRGGRRVITLQSPATGETFRYNVKIPEGIREGQRIRLSGKGGGAPSGGEAGDLFLRVRFQKHPYFRVDGDDLNFDVPVQVWEAVLGSEKELDTFDGKIRLKIPAGTQPGQKFRFRGRGMKTRSGGRGDLYGVVDIEVPRKLTDESRRLWESLRSAGG